MGSRGWTRAESHAPNAAHAVIATVPINGATSVKIKNRFMQAL